jgi:hypothetical protein
LKYKRKVTISLIFNQKLFFSVEIQTSRLQDVADGREAAEVDQLKVEPQKIRRKRGRRKRRKSQQDVH